MHSGLTKVSSNQQNVQVECVFFTNLQIRSRKNIIYQQKYYFGTFIIHVNDTKKLMNRLIFFGDDECTVALFRLIRT